MQFVQKSEADNIFERQDFWFPLNPRHVRWAVIGSFVVLLLMLLPFLRSVLFIFAFIALNIFISYMIRDFVNIPIGAELITLSTALSAAAYGFGVGAMVGIISIVLHYVISHRYVRWALLTVPGYVGVAFLAATFMSGVFSAATGLAIVFVYNIFTAGGSLFLGAMPSRAFLWSATNILINFVVFVRIAPLLASILGIG